MRELEKEKAKAVGFHRIIAMSMKPFQSLVKAESRVVFFKFLILSS